MERESNQEGRGFEWFRCGDESDDQRSRGDSDRAIRARAVAPTTVEVSDLSDGALFLQIWPGGPSTYLSPADAVSLKRELVAAFGREPAGRSRRGETR